MRDNNILHTIWSCLPKTLLKDRVNSFPRRPLYDSWACQSNRASAYGTPLDGATVKVVITTVNKT